MTEPRTRDTPGFAASITVEQLEADPYPPYARLRADELVAWVPAIGAWMATRWDDVNHVASTPDDFPAWTPAVDRTLGTPNILSIDGPLHKQLRATLNPTLRPNRVEAYIERLVRPIAERYVQRIAPHGRAELMADYFEPISVRSLGDVMGLSDVDADTLRRWFHGLAQGAINYEQDPERQAIGDAAAAEIDARLDERLTRLEHDPDDGMISHMLHEGTDGRPRPREEVLPSLKVILLGGMQEPGHGAGSAMLGLLSRPEQLREVAADGGELVAAAIEEGMRWIAPIGTQARRVARDLELAGAALPQGDLIVAVIASANRDETRFRDPDRFDLHRPKQRNATFGFGPHFCSGHAFARAQERIALEVLLQALPAIELDPALPPIVTGWEFRAPRRLAVRWTGAA